MFKAYPGKVIVHEMERGEQRTASGIILGNDEAKTSGIRARWAKVYAKGEDITDIEVGDWILVEHGRWTRGITYGEEYLFMVDYPAGVTCAATQEEMPNTRSVSSHASAKEHTFRPEMFSEYTTDKLYK